jgi:transposase
MRTPGTAAEREFLRKRAVEAVREGQSPSTVARAFGVHRVSLQRWLRQAKSPGGLDAKPVRRASALSDDQLQALEVLLLQGASKHGWPNDLWTAARVQQMILRHFGIAFHPEHVRKVLKRRLGWTSQKPQTQAKERDEDEIRRWTEEEFPRIVREAQQRDAHLLWLDESCFQLTPTVRRTLAPRGQTPILPCWDKRDKISAISAITRSPRQHRPGLLFQLLPDQENFHGAEVVAFLKLVRRQLRRFTVVWDRSPIHRRSRVVRSYLAEHPEIVVEDLPGYAPELNPDELVWSWTKYGRLSNYAAAQVAALRHAILTELEDLQQHPYMLLDFLDHTGLPLDATAEKDEPSELRMAA